MEWASKVHLQDRDIQAISAELCNNYKMQNIVEEELPPPPPLEAENLFDNGAGK
eukprot:TRINITY_DN13668_c0_g1_i1.p3 TRINITY_DN13668_c0_g1~~TRINITY_DN13668_c0_g1_i1.p3  ORF type:complete len:54 (+),score=9.57 TRINITY_DN13668_c0_g1_i1:504-665(+)